MTNKPKLKPCSQVRFRDLPKSDREMLLQYLHNDIEETKKRLSAHVTGGSDGR